MICALEKPHPFGRPKSERFPKAKPLTIAAGFRFDESLFLCSDSLWNDGFTKHFDAKIFHEDVGWHAEALFALAGNGDYAKMLYQQLVSASQGRDYSLPKIRDVFSQEVVSFYNTHAAAIGDSGVQLLIAISHESDGMEFLVCTNSACRRGAAFEFIGCGASIARPLADWLHSPFMNDADRKLLALTTIYGVKLVDPNCDGATQFGWLCKGRHNFIIDSRGVPKEEQYIREFFAAAGHAMFRCSLSRDEESAQNGEKRFSDRIKKIRETLK